MVGPVDEKMKRFEFWKLHEVVLKRDIRKFDMIMGLAVRKEKEKYFLNKYFRHHFIHIEINI